MEPSWPKGGLEKGFPPFLLIIKKNKMKTPMNFSILARDNAVLALPSLKANSRIAECPSVHWGWDAKLRSLFHFA